MSRPGWAGGERIVANGDVAALRKRNFTSRRGRARSVANSSSVRPCFGRSWKRPLELDLNALESYPMTCARTPAHVLADYLTNNFASSAGSTIITHVTEVPV